MKQQLRPKITVKTWPKGRSNWLFFFVHEKVSCLYGFCYKVDQKRLMCLMVSSQQSYTNTKRIGLACKSRLILKHILLRTLRSQLLWNKKKVQLGIWIRMVFWIFEILTYLFKAIMLRMALDWGKTAFSGKLLRNAVRVKLNQSWSFFYSFWIFLAFLK